MPRLFAAGTLAVLPLAALAALVPAPAAAQIRAVSLVGDLAFPVDVKAPPGDTERLFIVGQKGTILILENGALLAQPFLDLSAEVHQGGGEQGLLSLAFHPDYAVNGHFFVSFTTGAGAGKSVIRRYTVSANPDSADEASGHVILELTQPQTNHNGGNLLFGPDGRLWTGFGDGGAGGAPSRDPQRLLGKIVRIDPDGDDFPADPIRNYAIPPDNPFVSDPATLDEIWALGLRNPWRFSFDRATGDLWIGDVGQNTWEEIDWEPATVGGGRDYGWNRMEGPQCVNPPTDCNADSSLTLPIHAWMHEDEGACYSVSGGYVYRGAALPPGLVGHYFYSDYCQQRLFSFRNVGGTVTEFTEWTAALDVGNALKFPASFWEDEAGELYVVEYRAAVGEIWKIVPDPGATYAGIPAAAGAARLSAPRPNPFGEATSLELFLERARPVEVTVHDAAGRRLRGLREGILPAGPNALTWDGRDAAGRPVPAGVYFVRARVGGETFSRRVTRLR